MSEENKIDSVIELITKDVANISRNANDLQTKALETLNDAVKLLSARFSMQDDDTITDKAELRKLKVDMAIIHSHLILGQGDILMLNNTLLITRDSYPIALHPIIMPMLITLQDQADTLLAGNQSLLNSIETISEHITEL